jgi:molybdopterin-containing oxidoreductase family iron-sulfur binding subunit
MKRTWQHPESKSTNTRAWRGQQSLEATPEARQWLEREFQDGAGDPASEVNRRDFVRLMGASAALAGFAGVSCRKPESYLVPHTKNVEWQVPGKALLYSTAMGRGHGAEPLLVTTYEGRPTKLDGNPLHPHARGGSDSLVQAEILELYDPDRSRLPMAKGKTITADAMEAELVKLQQELASTQGKGIGFLVGISSSPTRLRLIDEMRRRFSGTKWFAYEALESGNLSSAADKYFGPGVRPVAQFSKAQRVLALDCDFLGTEKISSASVAEFAASRKPEDDEMNLRKDMARLYVAEPAFTVTGGMADHRLRVAGSQVVKLAVLIAKGIATKTKDAALAAIVDSLNVPVGDAEFDSRWISECANDLAEHTGKAIVLAGERQPAEVHQLVFAINQALEAYGEQGCAELFQSRTEEFGSLTDLKAAIDKGKVTTLVLTTPADPAYDTPADFRWSDVRARLAKVVQLGTRLSRTAMEADLHVPGTHFLEAWGDVYDARGVYSLVQPVILPLYGGTSELQLLARLLAPVAEPAAAAPADAAAAPATPKPDAGFEAVRATFAEVLRGTGKNDSIEDAWNQTLRDGFLAGTAFAKLPGAAGKTDGLTPGLSKLFRPAPTFENPEFAFAVDASVLDGRLINNAWMQEAPDPVTKLTWDNAALMSPTTAQALGVYAPKPRKFTDHQTDRFQSLGDGDQTVPMVRLTVEGISVEMPVLVAFGHVDNVITLPLGYGQSGDRPGQPKLPMRVGHGTGFDVNPLRRLASPYFTPGKIDKTEERYTLALTQEHGAMEGRAIVRAGSLSRYEQNPGFAAVEAEDSHVPENISLYKPVGFDRRTGEFDRPHLFDEKHQWAMTIDLSQCTGCNACLVACQAENNIPIVGKEQVRRGREMHWIRMDRYFVGRQDKHGHFLNEDNPEMLMQPVACVQCESAPCETVCPVNATVHSEDGLNLMAYNRCIGTRYCANNCPYKARRFNYFDYNKRPLNELYRGPVSREKGVPKSLQLQKNPNVTVRMRGVMEKCTYCIQRLEGAKIKQMARRRKKPQELGVPSDKVELSIEEIRIPTDSVKVACQQACPSEAIVFGNLLDPKCAIRRHKEFEMRGDRRPIVSRHPRNYDLLNYIGTLPRTSYLARIKNPNPKMPDGEHVGNATISIH